MTEKIKDLSSNNFWEIEKKFEEYKKLQEKTSKNFRKNKKDIQDNIASQWETLFNDLLIHTFLSPCIRTLLLLQKILLEKYV